MKDLMFPKKIKVPKKPSTRILTKLLSKVVCKLANGVCWICGREGTQACHIFSKKAYPKSRWDYTNNVKWGCFGCHKGSKFSMHENPEWFREWYDKKFGIGAMDRLKTLVCLAESTSGKLDLILIRLAMEEELK